VGRLYRQALGYSLLAQFIRAHIHGIPDRSELSYFNHGSRWPGALFALLSTQSQLHFHEISHPNQNGHSAYPHIYQYVHCDTNTHSDFHFHKYASSAHSNQCPSNTHSDRYINAYSN